MVQLASICATVEPACEDRDRRALKATVPCGGKRRVGRVEGGAECEEDEGRQHKDRHVKVDVGLTTKPRKR